MPRSHERRGSYLEVHCPYDWHLRPPLVGVDLLGALLVAMAAAQAGAQVTSASSTGRRTLEGSAEGERQPQRSDVDATESMPYWSRGESRPFLSGRAVPGLGFGRFALSGGYGKPHWIWAGAEGIAAVTPYYASFQAGVHASAALVDAMITVRRTYSFSHGLLSESASLSSADLDRSDVAKLRYEVIDASLWGFVPYRRLLTVWELTVVRPLTVSENSLLYEEVQRVIVSRHGLWTTKLSPMFKPWASKEYYGGPFVEHLTLLGRRPSLVIRLGPSVWANLNDHWSLYGTLSWPILSPDRLDFWDGMYGSVGLMVRFATGEPATPTP